MAAFKPVSESATPRAVEPAVPVLITPYGGRLVDLRVPPERREERRAYASGLPSIRLSERALCDLELLAVGGFSPLDRFMTRADHDRVVEEMRLADGTLFPIPVTLPIKPAAGLQLDREIALRGPRNELVAVMTVEEIYGWDRRAVAERVFGTTDPAHPLVAEMAGWGSCNLSGRLEVIELPARHDFRELRLTPAETRARLGRLGRSHVVAFQTRNPLHRGHEELLRRAMDKIDGTLLIHPVVGMTRPGDVDHFTRVRTYQAVLGYYDPARVVLALLPLAMRLAGPREAVWHALIRRNYGASHFIVGRDHASPGADSQGRPFYGPYDAQALAADCSGELGVEILSFDEMVYVPAEGRFRLAGELDPKTTGMTLSGTQVREEFLREGRPLPEWYVRPEVAQILAETFVPRHREGVCVWFTGLSGSGKSTTAEILTVLLAERGRRVTLLDGDVVRTHLSKGLGFSREDRDENIRRIGFVAAEVVRHGGVAVCAAVSPYRAVRDEVRALVGPDHFVEVFMDTPPEVCEQRDTKGLYARARRGELRSVAGLDDPYEPPLAPEVTLDTVAATAEENARAVLRVLIKRGFVRGAPEGQLSP